MADSKKSATLTLDGKSYDLPIHSPTLGPDVLDIRKLYAEADVFTFDPGFTSTAACESAITYIDGDKGELLHRGYPIEQLADKSSYLELCYLLLYAELPTAAQLADFRGRVTRHTTPRRGSLWLPCSMAFPISSRSTRLTLGISPPPGPAAKAELARQIPGTSSRSEENRSSTELQPGAKRVGGVSSRNAYIACSPFSLTCCT